LDGRRTLAAQALKDGLNATMGHGRKPDEPAAATLTAAALQPQTARACV
jgi:hypothetical protein